MEGSLLHDERVRALILAIAIGLLAVVLGWAIAVQTAVALALVLLAVVVALGYRWPWLGALAVLISCTNTVPFLNLGFTGASVSGLTGPDVGGVLALVYWAIWPKRPRDNRSTAGIDRWLIAFTALWLLQVVRSVALDGIPVAQAALYGRSFAFALPAFLMAAALPRADVRLFHVGAIVWGSVFSALYLAQAVGGVNGEFLIHALSVREGAIGIGRIYSTGSELAILALLLGIGVLWRSDQPVHRALGWVAVALGGVQAVLQMSRAILLVVPASIVVALALDALRRRDLHGAISRLPGGLVVAVAGIAAAGSVLGQVYEILTIRLGAAAVDVAGLAGNVGYRVDLVGRMTAVLGAMWPVGLGFLHPAVKPVSTLPGGAIMSLDVGVFSLLMTMGAVGVVVWWGACISGGRLALRGTRSGRYGFVAWGVMAWVVYGLLASPTILPTPLVTGALLGSVVGLMSDGEQADADAVVPSHG